MRGRTRTAVLVAGISAMSLLAAACGGGAEEPAATGKKGGDIVAEGCTPEEAFIPSNTGEVCGGDPLDLMTAKLVKYNTDTAKAENDIAESIETTDNQNFTVKLNKGYKFHDGTEVKAKNFVDAWNYAAYYPNGQKASYFFTPIEGYEAMQSEDPDEDGPKKAPTPKADKLTGLKVVDDYTFTIKTTEKVANLPVRLGYTAFAPLPDSFFANPAAAEAYGKKPVGAGPYQFVSYTPDVEIKLTKFKDYSGKEAANPDNITFKIYTDQEVSYKDLISGGLDVMSTFPPSALLDDAYKKDLGDRNVARAYAGIRHVGFSPIDPQLKDVKLRKAISMAVNRQEIIDNVFPGYTPAEGWVPPGIDGFKPGACGEACKFDPAKAKALLAESKGYKGTLLLNYNADGPHKEWTTAACNQIKTNLGINCVAKGYVDFATMLKDLKDRKLMGMFRLGWQMDYPSIENFLAPLYGTGAESNYQEYSSPAFDQLLREAAAAPDAAASNAKYQEAEALLASDMPTFPVFFPQGQIGWSERLGPVKMNPFGVPAYNEITLK